MRWPLTELTSLTLSTADKLCGTPWMGGPTGAQGLPVAPGPPCLTLGYTAWPDGAYAAAFLRQVKEIIETRDWEAEL